MDKSDFDDYERRSRLYYTAFEEYSSLETTYRKFYEASNSLKRRGRILTYSSTAFGAILLFIIGTVVVRGGPPWGTDLALAVSILVAALSFFNAVDSPQRMSNVTYNSGQTLQRVFFDFHYFVTVRLPDPDETTSDLEEEYERLLEMKNTVNETTPQLGNKWYYRVKEKSSSWEPKPLLEVTGKNGEFAVESQAQDERSFRKAKSTIKSPFVRIVRWFGF